jgi:AraC-like DNA-binding protein
MTFREHLISVRLEKAKELLLSKRLSITQVSQMVGFGDLPRFDKLFKRHVGVTPSAYRVQRQTRRNKSQQSSNKLLAELNDSW